MLRLRVFGGIVIERGGVPFAETAEFHVPALDRPRSAPASQ